MTKTMSYVENDWPNITNYELKCNYMKRTTCQMQLFDTRGQKLNE